MPRTYPWLIPEPNELNGLTHGRLDCAYLRRDGGISEVLTALLEDFHEPRPETRTPWGPLRDFYVFRLAGNDYLIFFPMRHRLTFTSTVVRQWSPELCRYTRHHWTEELNLSGWGGAYRYLQEMFVEPNSVFQFIHGLPGISPTAYYSPNHIAWEDEQLDIREMRETFTPYLTPFLGPDMHSVRAMSRFLWRRRYEGDGYAPPILDLSNHDGFVTMSWEEYGRMMLLDGLPWSVYTDIGRDGQLTWLIRNQIDSSVVLPRTSNYNFVAIMLQGGLRQQATGDLHGERAQLRTLIEDALSAYPSNLELSEALSLLNGRPYATPGTG